MARHRDLDEEEEEEEEEEEDDDEEEEEEEPRRKGAAARGGNKRRRSAFIDDAAEEDDDGDEEEERVSRKGKKRTGGMRFIDDAADVNDDEEEEEDGEEGWVDEDVGEELAEEEDNEGGHRRPHRPPLNLDDGEDAEMEEYLKGIADRYGKRSDMEGAEEGMEASEVDQQALLPSVKDAKLWLMQCKIGFEREAVISLMQKFLTMQHTDTPLHIKSAVALDHLKGYIYVEAEKEAYARMACRGIRLIYTTKVKLVDIKEMPVVLTVEKKLVDLEVNAWVRIKIGLYKGDLAQVVDVDNVKQQATVKLVPRVDLALLEAKQDGKADATTKKKMRPPARFFTVDEAKGHGLKMSEVRDKETNEFVHVLEGMRFKDSYFWKTVSLKSLDKTGVVPTLDELQNFQRPAGEGEDESLTLLPLRLAQQQRARLMKGDVVQVVEGDLKGLMGTVEKVDGEEVIIRPRHKDLREPLPVNEKQLRKFFKTGDHVKVIAGMHDGSTGLIVKVEEQVVVILTDTSREHIKVFARDIVASAEVTNGITQFGDYELHDLVMIDQLSFGVIVKLEQGGCCQVLKNSPNRSDVAAVKFSDIKRKLLDRKATAEDGNKNPLAVKDPVRIIDGPWKGRQGVVEHLHRGVAFVFDRTFAQNGGFFCVRARSCFALAGKNSQQGASAADVLARRRGAYSPFSSERNGMAYSPVRQNLLQSPRNYTNGRGGPGGPGPPGSFGGGRTGHRRDHDSIVGTLTTIRMGNYKGYKGRVVDATDTTVRVELESQMKIITVKREHLAQGGAAPDHSAAAPYASRESPHYGAGSETPMHGSSMRTPMHPGSFFGGTRDPLGTPVHEGMRTPMHDRAWNPSQEAPATPLRGQQDAWEMGEPSAGPNSSSWPSSGGYQSQNQPFTPAYSPTENAASPAVMENPSTPVGARPYEGVPASPRNAGGWGASNGQRDDAPSPYANGVPSPYSNPSTPATGGYNPMTPAGEYLPGTPGGLPTTPGSVAGAGGTEEMQAPTPAMMSGGSEVFALMIDVLVTFGGDRQGVVREMLGDGLVFKVALGAGGDGEVVQVGAAELEAIPPKLHDRVKVLVPGDHAGHTGKLVSVVNNDAVVKLQGGPPAAFDLMDLGKYIP